MDILSSERVDADAIESIAVRTFEAAVIERPHRSTPATLFDAKMSVPFSLAVAALEGAAGEREFREELLSSPLHQAFASRVRVEADPKLTKAFPAEWPAYVRVVLKDGRVHERTSVVWTAQGTSAGS